jgi:hypothetical protein
VAVKTIGGKNLKSTLRALNKTKQRVLSVGFYPNSKYDDGLPVAQVAFWNEYGRSKIPERPFCRHANIMASKKMISFFKTNKISKSKSIINQNQINTIGKMWAVTIQESIEGKQITYVPNAPSTIKQKGHDKPLIDTELMLISPEYKVIK